MTFLQHIKSLRLRKLYEISHSSVGELTCGLFENSEDNSIHLDIDEFRELIAKCKRLGVDHQHLLPILDQFIEQEKLRNSLKELPPQLVPTMAM